MATTTNGGKGKPVAYELFPLSVLRGDDSDLFRPLTDEYINSILQFYEDLQEHEKTLNDAIEEWERRSHLQKLDAAIAKLREMKEEISAQSKALTRNMDVIRKLTEDLKFYSILTAALRRFHSFLSDKRVLLLPRGSRLETRLPRPDSGRDLRVLFTRFRPLEADPGLVAAFESEHGDFVKRRDGTGTSSAAAAAASTDFLIVDVELHPMHGSKDGTTKIFRCVVTKPPPLPKPLPSKSPPPSPSPSPKPSPLLKSPPPSPSPFGRDKVLGLLRRNIADAVFHGRIRDGCATKPLGKFETEADIVEDKERPDLLSEKDHGFSLYAADSESRSNLRGRLVRKYFDRKSEGIGTPAWCSAFRRHVEAIVQRRLSRVREWIRINTEAFRNDSAVATLLSNAEVDHFIPLRQFWTICEQKCQQCDRLCLKRSQHDEEHDCYTNHKCEHHCSYCSDSDAGRVYVCRHCGGHSGPHRCSENEHLCESACELAAHRGCLGTCSRDVAHVLDAADRLHRCKAKVHYCIERCDFVECSLDCSKSYDHDGGHECSVYHCPMLCSMDSCSNRCLREDESHSLDEDALHICKGSHSCTEACEMPGHCAIITSTLEGSEETETYTGRFETFSYVKKAPPLLQRKRCAISIPPGQTQHEGTHCHYLPDSPPEIHFCTSQCPTCQSACTKELNHEGRHRILHSNVIDRVFVSQSAIVNVHVGERKYGPGESAHAEICDDFCRRLGRGHTHVMRCQGDHGDDDPRVRHDVETQYADVVLDEVTHDYYWEYCHIDDNCSESEKELFRKCDYYCDAVKASPNLRSYCQLELWHEPLQSHAARDGHWSDHDYQCEHEHLAGYHIVFVVDKSATMSLKDERPSETSGLNTIQTFNNRLGAGLEAGDSLCRKRLRDWKSDALTLITFDDAATTHFVGVPMPSSISKAFLDKQIELSWGGTDFALALREAHDAISQFESSSPSNHDVIPVVIILSDGDSYEADSLSVLEAADSLRSHYPTAVSPAVFCIPFGSDEGGEEFLKKISRNQVFPSEMIIHLENVIRLVHEGRVGQGGIGVLPPNPSVSPLRSPEPIDSNEVLLFLRQNIEEAVFCGRFLDGSAEKPLEKFESKADIDSLYAADSESRSDLRNRLIRRYFDLKSEGIGTPAWCSSFRRHMKEFVERRVLRVKTWIRLNTEAFRDDSDVATLLSNAEVDHFIPLRQFWTICEQKCQQCDRLCLKQSQHDEEHDCYTSHKCEHRCSYCSDSDAGRVYVCSHCGGHSGLHRCSENEHLCESACDLAAHRGCLGTCSRDVAHVLDAADQLHRCKAKVHYCIERCDFLECNLDCSKSYDHDGGHECSGSHCPMFCLMDLCSNRCSCGDEPHSFHICKESHACSGAEEDWTYGKRGKLETFDGLFGTFSYRENATKRLQQRKRCAISIPPGQRYHQGFSCKTTLDAPLCTSQCPTCESTCVLDLHHKGFHRIEHSNMINQVFVSESEVISLGERKYGPGESAGAEVCDDFCRRLGRGHTHIIRCQGDHGDDDPRVRHDVKAQYTDVVLDEVTHDYYWEHCQIEDNCSESEKELFRKCDYYCDAVEVSPDLRTFCQLELWHEPLQLAPPDGGHISTNGHYFRCTHYHIVLVVDKSGTMSFEDQKPSETSGLNVGKLSNRLGAALEMCDKFCQQLRAASRGDALTLITFDDAATAHFVGTPVPSDISKAFFDRQVDLSWGGSYLSPALKEAKSAIAEFQRRSPANREFTPVVIVLTDGDCFDADVNAVVEANLLKRQCWSTARDEAPLLFCIRLGLDRCGEVLLKTISSNHQVLLSEAGIPSLKKVARAPVLHGRKAGQAIGVLSVSTC